MQNTKNNESVAYTELKAMLNRNLVKDSVIGSQMINNLVTESRTVRISPELANALLLRNNSNRPVNSPNVLRLANAMTKGEWVFDGMPITFDKNGNLLNGQHRLTAVVKSGKTIIFKVDTGFNPEIFSTMDIGKTRTGSDVLAIAGVENYGLCAQTANFIYKYMRGSIGSVTDRSFTKQDSPNMSLSHPELLKFVAVKPSLKDSVTFQIRTKKKQSTVLLKGYVISGLHFLFSEKSSAMADSFFSKLLTGDNLASTSPIFHLRNKLINAKTDRAKRLTHSEIVKLTVIAWNKYRNGESIKTLRIPESLPTIN